MTDYCCVGSACLSSDKMDVRTRSSGRCQTKKGLENTGKADNTLLPKRRPKTTLPRVVKTEIIPKAAASLRRITRNHGSLLSQKEVRNKVHPTIAELPEAIKQSRRGRPSNALKKLSEKSQASESSCQRKNNQCAIEKAINLIRSKDSLHKKPNGKLELPSSDANLEKITQPNRVTAILDQQPTLSSAKRKSDRLSSCNMNCSKISKKVDCSVGSMAAAVAISPDPAASLLPMTHATLQLPSSKGAGETQLNVLEASPPELPEPRSSNATVTDMPNEKSGSLSKEDTHTLQVMNSGNISDIVAENVCVEAQVCQSRKTLNYRFFEQSHGVSRHLDNRVRNMELATTTLIDDMAHMKQLLGVANTSASFPGLPNQSTIMLPSHFTHPSVTIPPIDPGQPRLYRMPPAHTPSPTLPLSRTVLPVMRPTFSTAFPTMPFSMRSLIPGSMPVDVAPMMTPPTLPPTIPADPFMAFMAHTMPHIDDQAYFFNFNTIPLPRIWYQ